MPVIGRYFENCNEAELTTDPGSQAGVHSHALDGGDAARLWDLTMELLHPWRETI